MDLQQLVIDIRELTGWSQTALAERARTSQSTIHRIEEGKTKNPGSDVGFALMKIHNELTQQQQ